MNTRHLHLRSTAHRARRLLALLSTFLLATGAWLACEPGSGDLDAFADTSTDDTSSTSADTTPQEDGTDDGTDVLPSGQIQILDGGSVLSSGGDHRPMELDGVPPWSMGVTRVGVFNSGSQDITLTGARIEGIGETDPREWFFNQVGTVSYQPVDYVGQVLAPETGIEIGFYFRPIASGQRDARVVLDFSDGSTATFNLRARGRDNLTLSPTVASSYERMFARSNALGSHWIMPGAIEVDSANNLYLYANTNQYSDGFSEDLMLAQIRADGSLGWVKEWHEPYQQEARDIGDNQEIGGADASLDIDSSNQIYFTAQRSDLSSNNLFTALVVRVDAQSGDLVWARYLKEGDGPQVQIARDGLMGQVLDASLSDRVIVAGSSDNVDDRAFVAALSKDDGSIIWARRLFLAANSTTRLSGMRIHDGDLYASGIHNNTAVMFKITDVDSDNPTLEWVKAYQSFSIMKQFDFDGRNLLAALEIRGATTHFVVTSIDPESGEVRWAKVWDPENSGSVNVARGVLLDGTDAWAYGHIGFAPFDTGGDSFLVKLDASSGEYKHASLYYGGKGAEEVAKHDITDLEKTPSGELYAIAQIVPGAQNRHHFWGMWYQANDYGLGNPGGDGSERWSDYPLAAADALEGSELNAPTRSFNVFALEDTAEIWRDYRGMTLEDPQVNEEQGFQTGIHVQVRRIDVLSD